MGGTTDQPFGSRPFCSECGQHRWDRDGKCLSSQCSPLQRDGLGRIVQADVKVKPERPPVPDWMKKRKPSKGRQMREALAYCAEMEIDPPWEQGDMR